MLITHRFVQGRRKTENASKHENTHVVGSIPNRLTHSSMPLPSASISIIATKRSAQRRRTSGHHRASDQGDNCFCVVPDADKVQLQRVGFVDERQPTCAKVVARCRVRGRRNDRVPRGSTGVRCQTAVYASRDAGVSLHQGHRTIGLGGDQTLLGWCAASAEFEHQVAAKRVLEDLL